MFVPKNQRYIYSKTAVSIDIITSVHASPILILLYPLSPRAITCSHNVYAQVYARHQLYIYAHAVYILDELSDRHSMSLRHIII
jgi:hypothetical protein